MRLRLLLIFSLFSCGEESPDFLIDCMGVVVRPGVVVPCNLPEVYFGTYDVLKQEFSASIADKVLCTYNLKLYASYEPPVSCRGRIRANGLIEKDYIHVRIRYPQDAMRDAFLHEWLSHMLPYVTKKNWNAGHAESITLEEYRLKDLVRSQPNIYPEWCFE